MECTRWYKNQQAYLEVIWKENKTDDVICLHFGVYGNICGHMIPSSVKVPSYTCKRQKIDYLCFKACKYLPTYFKQHSLYDITFSKT